MEWQAGDPGEVDDFVYTVRLLRKLPHGAGGKDEGEQHHSGADQIDQEFQRGVVMMSVLMLMRVPVIMSVVVIVGVAMIMRVSVIVGMAMTVRMAVAMFVDRLDAGATATSLLGCGSSVLPKASIRAAPRSGNRGISQM